MACGYVLIAVEPKAELEVYGELLKIEAITEVCPVLGAVDFIAKVKMDSYDDIATLVIKYIRVIPGVTSTKTFVEDEFLKHLQKIVE
ncbi:MAG: Lrp/AsnC ligand binding domain-containing protein [Methanobacteriota archaeon]